MIINEVDSSASAHTGDKNLRKTEPEKLMSDGRKHGQDTRGLLKIVCSAYLNPGEYEELSTIQFLIDLIEVHIPRDIEKFYKEGVEGRGDDKFNPFSNPKFSFFSNPLTVVDVKGRIFLQYLPGLLSQDQGVSVYVLC